MFPYLLFLYKHKQIGLRELGKAFFAALGYATKSLEAGRAKQMALDFLRTKTAEDLAIYNRKFLQKLYVFEGAREEINNLRAKGIKIILVSASCDVYLQYAKDILDVDAILCTRVQNGIVQKNCKGPEKIQRILEYLEQKREKIDFENSYAYGDSASDLHMMELVKNKIIVNNQHLFKKLSNEKYAFVEWV